MVKKHSSPKTLKPFSPKPIKHNNALTHSSNHSSAVIYSIVIRSFSTRFPFQKGKNEGNISENDMIKNDATSSPEGTQRNVRTNLQQYRNAEESWRNSSQNKE